MGIGLAWFVYVSRKIDWQALRIRLWGTKQTLQRGFYVNDSRKSNPASKPASDTSSGDTKKSDPKPEKSSETKSTPSKAD